MACALRQFAGCVADCTDQVTSEAVAGNYDVLPVSPGSLAPSTAFSRYSCCAFVTCLQGDLGQYV
jgi:hypothetical protein